MSTEIFSALLLFPVDGHAFAWFLDLHFSFPWVAVEKEKRNMFHDFLLGVFILGVER